MRFVTPFETVQMSGSLCNWQSGALSVEHFLELMARSYPYYAVNTLRLGYKNQSVNAV